MNKLKTLKDLNWTLDMKTSWMDISTDLNKLILKPKNEVVNIQDLKDEAINWIKRLQETLKFTGGEMDGYQIWNEDFPEADILIKWIKYFFGIKDEDLK